MDDRPDASLVARARAGDKEAFGSLIERHQAMARRVAMGVLGHEDVGREMAQEAMLQAYLSLDRLRDDERLQSWLYGIVLNVCRSFIRDQRVDFLSLEALTGGLRFEAISFGGVEPDPEEVAEARELHETVLRAVDALSPKNRVATLMFYYEQLSVRDIAATLGVSVAAVKTRLHRSRDRLKEHLLPLFADHGRTNAEEREDKTMIKVEIADVKVTKAKDGPEGSSPRHVVILLDRDGGRVLPIWIGPHETIAIAIGLKDFPVPRPMTHAFMADVLDAIGAAVEEVRVEALKEDTFYAVVKLHSGSQVREVDARPSDAIALAVHTGAPIYAAEEVIEKAGIPLEGEVGEKQPMQEGLKGIVKELEEGMAKWDRMTAEEKVEAMAKMALTHEYSERAYEYLFGGEGEEA